MYQCNPLLQSIKLMSTFPIVINVALCALNCTTHHNQTDNMDNTDDNQDDQICEDEQGMAKLCKPKPIGKVKMKMGQKGNGKIVKVGKKRGWIDGNAGVLQ